MNEMRPKSRRAGGRQARLEKRARPPEIRAIGPGQVGGAYRPLSQGDLEKVHHAVLDILENIGLAEPIPSCVEAITAVGGRLSETGRLLFPRALVEDMLARIPHELVLHGRDPRHDMDLSGRRVHFGTAGAAVHLLDLESGEYRDSTLLDLYDIARLVDTRDNIHFFQRSVVTRDLEDPFEMDLNTCYASVAGTSKHVGTAFTTPEAVHASVDMLDMIAGGEGAFAARPFVSMSCCFVVPPLRFALDACRCLEAGVARGIPILLLSAGQAGATSPAALAGSLAQSVAEVLAGTIYVNALKPGHPTIFGTWPFVSDLRTGAMSGGSGEQALLAAAAAQMAGYYGLPNGVPAGMADSKIPDAQSGYEKGYTTALAGLAGSNLVYEAAGMHASLLGAAFESYVIDDDMLGAVLRCVRGIEVNDDTLSLQAMREVVEGPVHYLGHAQTLDLMQREYAYPTIGDRANPSDWMDAGALDIRERARQLAREILATHYPENIPGDVDDRVRAAFPIKLPRSAMRAPVA